MSKGKSTHKIFKNSLIKILLEHHGVLVNTISKVIEYSEQDDHYEPDLGAIYNYTNIEWTTEGRSLYLDLYADHNEGLYEFTISSYSDQGDAPFAGEYGDYTFIMAYPPDSTWKNRAVYILKTENNVIDLRDG